MIVINRYAIEYDKARAAYRIISARPSICPDCGQVLSGYDTRKRHAIDGSGAVRWFLLRRLRCSGCGKIHLELPDFIQPQKHYESQVIRETLTGLSDHCPADDSTIWRWRNQNNPPGLHSAFDPGAVNSTYIDTKEEES